MPTASPHGTSREVYMNDALPTGTNYIGHSAAPLQHVDVAPVLDTAAYTAGDVLFDRTLVTNATRLADALAVLESLRWLDEDDQAAANITLLFLDADVAVGTINNAPSISDANARNILGVVPLATTDLVDIGGAKVASLRNIGLVVKPASGTRNIWVAAITAGTPTHTASGVKLRLGFRSA